MGVGAAGCLASMYSWLVCARLCTKQWKNSGYSAVTFAGSSLWATISILCLAPCPGGQPCQQCPPVPSPPVFQRPWQDTRGQKEREACVFRDSCASPPWRFPSCSLKPSGPPPPPRLVWWLHAAAGPGASAPAPICKRSLCRMFSICPIWG